MAHSKKRRASLFSLSARIRRRTPVSEIVVARGAENDVDDNCPLCIAARAGRPVSFDMLHDRAFLAAEARRLLARVKLAPGEDAILVEAGRMLPDRTFEILRYTVDAEGCVFLVRNETRRLVMRLVLD
jgi:hypothetical protein